MSKYCTKCGKVVCPRCGCLAEGKKLVQQSESVESSLTTTAKVFAILGCVFSAFLYLIPLAWTIPMTVTLCNKIKRGEKISVGFAVCILIFLNTISGILILCNDKILDNDN